MYLTVYGMNKLLFDKIYFFTVKNKQAKQLAIFISNFSKPAFIIIYILGIIALLIHGGEGVAEVTAVPCFTLFFNTAVRKYLNMPRPFLRDDVSKLVEHENSGSFPSNHACSSMIISLSYLIIYPTIVPYLILFAFFTGLSRVMTGVHYPLDVICGWLLSLFIGLTFFVIL